MAELRIYQDPHDLGCVSFVVPDRLGTEDLETTERLNEILGWGEAAFDAEGRLVHLGDWTFPVGSSPKIERLQRTSAPVLTERFDVPDLGLSNVTLLDVLRTLQAELIWHVPVAVPV